MKARPAVVPDRRKAPQQVGRPPIAPGSPGGTERDDLALPHERDESMTGQTHPEGQGQTPDVMRQAYDDIVSGQVYWNGGGIWFRDKQPGQSELMYQINNWYFFTWLCGDHINEQHIHTAVHQAAHLLAVRSNNFIPRGSAVTGVVHIRRKRECFIHRTDCAGYKAWFCWIACRLLIGGFAYKSC